MEFVIWDDGLSCEDENATESELFAGILYFWKQEIETLSQSGYYVAIKTKCTRFEVIQTVGFLQAIKNFVRIVVKAIIRMYRFRRHFLSV